MIIDSSSQDADFPSFDQSYKNAQIDFPAQEKKINKKCLIIIIIISILIILIVGAILAAYFINKKKEDGGTLILTYMFDILNPNFKLFNEVDFNNNDFEIDYNGTYPIRNLNNDDNKNMNNPNICSDGFCKLTIKFTKALTNLEGLFSNIKELRTADFSKFNSKKIKNMNKLFSNCTNLEKVNFTNFESKNLLTMDYCFENCSQLIEIDLNSFNTPKLLSMNSAFKGCSNLLSLNIKNFIINSNVNTDNIFEGCIFLNDIVPPNNNSEIIINELRKIPIEKPEECRENEECEKCRFEQIGNLNISTCEKCHKGFYINDNSINCRKCPENCDECYSEYNCNNCKDGFDLNKESNICLLNELSISNNYIPEQGTDGTDESYM